MSETEGKFQMRGTKDKFQMREIENKFQMGETADRFQTGGQERKEENVGGAFTKGGKIKNG